MNFGIFDSTGFWPVPPPPPEGPHGKIIFLVMVVVIVAFGLFCLLHQVPNDRTTWGAYDWQTELQYNY